MGLGTAQEAVKGEFEGLYPELADNDVAVLFKTVRVVEEKERVGGGHPLECEVWVLEGRHEGFHEQGHWVFKGGMVRKLNPTPGEYTVAAFQRYKNEFSNKQIGLTTPTEAQEAKGAAKHRELEPQEYGDAPGGGDRTAAGVGGRSSDGSKFPDEAPF